MFVGVWARMIGGFGGEGGWDCGREGGGRERNSGNREDGGTLWKGWGGGLLFLRIGR